MEFRGVGCLIESAFNVAFLDEAPVNLGAYRLLVCVVPVLDGIIELSHLPTETRVGTGWDVRESVFDALYDFGVGFDFRRCCAVVERAEFSDDGVSV